MDIIGICWLLYNSIHQCMDIFTYFSDLLNQSTQLIDAVDDFCSDVTPLLSDVKILKVNAMIKDITNLFNKVMLGFPDVFLQLQDTIQVFLL